jgi:hypothetical protein
MPMKQMAKGMLASLRCAFSGQDFLLAIIVSSGAVIVLLYGAMGITGNQVLTAAILFVPTVALFFGGRFAGFRPNLIDGLFVSFLICICATTLVNGIPPIRELQLLVLSLLNYPAARFLAVRKPQWSFVATTSAIVAAGAVATAIALAQQWDTMIGKPIVFGFGHAATVFSTSLCFLAINLASGSLDARRIICVCAGLFVPLAIFAASQVRFIFVAGAFALTVVATAGQRWRTLLIMAALGFAILTGLATNYRLTALHVTRDIFGQSEIVDDAQAAKDPAWVALAACLGPGSYRNSIAIRRALLGDAVAQIPSAGFFGTGLASFRSACLGSESPHNSPLQAIVEFGWIGGLAFAALITVALLRLWPLSFEDAGARFVLASLIFTVTVSMAYGQLQAEVPLYLFLGLSAACVNRCKLS